MKLLLDGVSFVYSSGITALNDVDLDIGEGEAVAIVGANGAGKTTLAKHFNGLLRPSKGKVFVGGYDTAGKSVSDLAHDVAFAFQNPEDQLFARTVEAEVGFGPRNLGLDEREVEIRVSKSLGLMSLTARGDSHPYDLNPSERKLVALAATLAMEAPVTILDEPTSGQDALGAAKVRKAIRSLKSSGRTVLAISHDLDFCVENFARTIVMISGRVIADGQTQAVLADADLLAQAHLEPPQLIRLAQKIEMPRTARSVDEFVASWKAWNTSKERTQ